MKLTMHIGGPKCGSTAIQHYLNVNHSKLADHGVLVPGQQFDPEGENKGGQLGFFVRVAADAEREKLVRYKFTAAHAFMELNDFSRLVFSAENLCSFRAHQAECFRHALDMFDCEVIMYVRRQDDFIASGWKQWGLKEFDTLQDWIDDCIRIGFADWTKRLEPWRQVFGANRIRVRVYDRARLNDGNITSDYLHLTDLAFEDCEIPNMIRNPSIDNDLAELAHRIRDVFKSRHDTEPFRILGPLIGDGAYTDQVPSGLLNRDQQRQIADRHRESNSRLQDLYFPDMQADNQLFPDQIQEEQTDDVIRQLKAENALLLRAVYNLAKKQIR